MNFYDGLVESRYDQFLAEGKDRESPIITLKDIPEAEKAARIASLEKKLGEYTDRLRTEWELEITAFELLDTDNRLKRDVLRILLKKGEVNTYSISKALVHFGSYWYGDAFNNACSVIGDYVKTGGKIVTGGTGLPTPTGS